MTLKVTYNQYGRSAILATTGFFVNLSNKQHVFAKNLRGDYLTLSRSTE